MNEELVVVGVFFIQTAQDFAASAMYFEPVRIRCIWNDNSVQAYPTNLRLEYSTLCKWPG